jgi:hypothetical protein
VVPYKLVPFLGTSRLSTFWDELYMHVCLPIYSTYVGVHLHLTLPDSLF